MNLATKLVVSAFSGLVGGAAIVLIVLMACLGTAFWASTDVVIPGVFAAWVTSENDLPALTFRLNGIGILVIVLSIAGLSMLGTLWTMQKKRLASEQ